MADNKKIVLTIQREYESTKQGGWTLGKMSIADTAKTVLFTCEDEFRAVKVKGETRIPAGIYEIDYNTTGGMNTTYKKLYPEMHKGMIEIKNIPNFTSVYIHIGNTEKNTEGCPLVGMTRDIKNGTVGSSRVAYTIFYKSITGILDKAKAAKEKIYIEIKDIPKAVKK